MDTKTFFSNFGHLADAPNGVQKLRELILQLAVRGKLVPQDPADEPASELLKRIKAEKARLVKEKKIRKADPLPAVTAEEAPYELPQGWEWVRLAMLGQTCGGGTPSKNVADYWKGPIPWVSPKDMKTAVIKQTELTISSKAVDNSSVRFIPPFSILIVARSGILKRTLPVCVNAVECTVNQDIKVLIPYVSGITRYLQLLLRGYEREILQNLVKGGMTVQSLMYCEFFLYPFPLPPVAEQERIIAAVDKLVVICDRLESRQQKSQQKLLSLNNAALGRLTSASGGSDFAAAWRLVRDSFDLLYTTPETIAKLRQAILQLAVQGKLVPQDPNDEPASKLLERIRAEKDRLVKEKKIRNNDVLPPVAAHELPFELPPGWERVRLGNIAINFQNGMSKRFASAGTPVPVLRLADIKGGRVVEGCLREIPLSPEEITNYCLKKGDVLIIRVNGSADLVGTFIPFMSENSISFCDHLIRMTVTDAVSYEYLSYFANTTCARSHISAKTITTAGQNTINQSGVGALPVALPPFAEQQRIVSKINRLMAFCDALEGHLKRAKEKGNRVTRAVVQDLVAC